MSKRHRSLDDVPRAPRQPGALAKKAVLRLVPGAFALLFTGLFVSVVFGLMVGMAIEDFVVDRMLAQSGVQITAHVVHVGAPYHRKNSGEWQELDVTYDVAGRSYPFTTHMPLSWDYTTGHVGDPIKLRYLPSHPTWARRAGREPTPAFVLVFLIFPLTGVVLAVVPILLWVRRRSVYRHGVPVAGLALGIGPGGLRVNRKRVPQLKWGYDVGGRSYTGSLYLHFDSPLLDLRSGDPVVVLYLPDQPQRSILYVAERGT